MQSYYLFLLLQDFPDNCLRYSARNECRDHLCNENPSSFLIIKKGILSSQSFTNSSKDFLFQRF